MPFNTQVFLLILACGAFYSLAMLSIHAARLASAPGKILVRTVSAWASLLIAFSCFTCLVLMLA